MIGKNFFLKLGYLVRKRGATTAACEVILSSKAAFFYDFSNLD